MRKWRGSMQPLEKGRPPYLLRWLSGWEDAGRSQRRVPGLLMSVSALSLIHISEPTRLRQEEIAEALATTGWQKIQLEQLADGDSVSIPAEMQLDLGAVGKGVALDEILKILEVHPEVSGAVISVGGSILTYGSKPEGGAWQIAVTDPLDPSESVGVLTLDGGHCVSTSGDYERYVEVDGVRYHHILDPRTGSPAHSDVAGVTIVTKDGFLSDALSTACFVLGQEEGQQLLEKYDAEGLFIDHEGTITMTEGMRQYFHLSNSQK